MTSSLPPDPWKALGIERTADKAEIRSAYKKLVLKCHPDKVQDPTLKQQKQIEFQKVQQAYELLNNDAERAKYEQKLRLAELQRAAAKVQQEAKTSSNTSVPRTSTRYASYDIRTPEPTSRYKGSPASGKVYAHYTTVHSRFQEEMPSSRVYHQVYEESDRQARRAASYEKPSMSDEERHDREKEERRRRREEEELMRAREKERDRERERLKAERGRDKLDRERERLEREKERDREARKAEKKKADKEREKERSRRRKPYVEDEYADIYSGTYVEELWIEDEKYVTSRPSEKKRSSSRKHDDARDRGRERDKSSSRVASEWKSLGNFEDAMRHMESTGIHVPPTEKTFWTTQTPPETFLTPPAPTPPPPPVDYEDESIRRASARAAGRRASNDPARSREKLKYDADPSPKAARPIPPLMKSYSSSAAVPDSPPRVGRSQTMPHESPYARAMPSLPRTQTWAPGGVGDDRRADYFDGYESGDDRDRRHRRSGRRATRSPSAQPTHRYKVEGTKTSKLEAQYSYSTSPSSTRRYAGDVLDAHTPSPSSTTYAGLPFRVVKESKAYGPGDVKYSEYNPPSSYYAAQTGSGEVYTVVA